MEKNNIDFTHWFFDLDNTLYCANSGIFDQIHKKMGEFISKNLKVNLKKAKFVNGPLANLLFEIVSNKKNYLNIIVEQRKIKVKKNFNLVYLPV